MTPDGPLSPRTVVASTLGSGEKSFDVEGNATGMDCIIDALKTVVDPEIPVNIYDLGLIYDINLNDVGVAEIVMTLTAPGCPVAGEIVSNVQRAVNTAEGVTAVVVQLVFDPPWDQSKMSEVAKLELGFL